MERPDLGSTCMSKPLSNSTFKHHLSPPALNVHSVGGGLLLFDIELIRWSLFGTFPIGRALDISSTYFVCLSLSAFHNVSPNNIERTTNYRRWRDNSAFNATEYRSWRHPTTRLDQPSKPGSKSSVLWWIRLFPRLWEPAHT